MVKKVIDWVWFIIVVLLIIVVHIIALPFCLVWAMLTECKEDIVDFKKRKIKKKETI